MGFLDSLFSRGKKTLPGGGRMAPCILCGKEIAVRPKDLANKFFYPLTGKHYACCSRGCDGRGAIDTNKIWSRIAAISESLREKSDINDLC